jgi:hypothetical protein
LPALDILLIAFSLVLLHRADGYEVIVNPSQVTSLRATIGRPSKLVPQGTRCMVGLTDGKFVSVVESCDEVRKLLEQVLAR